MSNRKIQVKMEQNTSTKVTERLEKVRDIAYPEFQFRVQILDSMETKASRDEVKKIGKRVEPAVQFVTNYKEKIKRLATLELKSWFSLRNISLAVFWSRTIHLQWIWLKWVFSNFSDPNMDPIFWICFS